MATSWEDGRVAAHLSGLSLILWVLSHWLQAGAALSGATMSIPHSSVRCAAGDAGLGSRVLAGWGFIC